jgi:hypothetical protein
MQPRYGATHSLQWSHDFLQRLQPDVIHQHIEKVTNQSEPGVVVQAARGQGIIDIHAQLGPLLHVVIALGQIQSTALHGATTVWCR